MEFSLKIKKKSNGKINNIKSNLIIKKIFSYLWINKKLDLIIYNKQFQKKFELKIEDYKNTSKKYKLFKGTLLNEYLLNTDILLFEGEYFISSLFKI